MIERCIAEPLAASGGLADGLSLGGSATSIGEIKAPLFFHGPIPLQGQVCGLTRRGILHPDHLGITCIFSVGQSAGATGKTLATIRANGCRFDILVRYKNCLVHDAVHDFGTEGGVKEFDFTIVGQVTPPGLGEFGAILRPINLTTETGIIHSGSDGGFGIKFGLEITRQSFWKLILGGKQSEATHPRGIP